MDAGPIADVVAAITANRPDVVFAPHVETAAGMILPDDYLRAVADAACGGRSVCARLHRLPARCGWTCRLPASTCWSAPQKGWSSSPCCAMVMLSERARHAIDGTTSTSFACDLKKWLAIMETYEGGARLPRHHAHRRPSRACGR